MASAAEKSGPMGRDAVDLSGYWEEATPFASLACGSVGRGMLGRDLDVRNGVDPDERARV